MDKGIIITGAAGFIGRYLVSGFLQREFRVCAVIRTKERRDELTDFLKKTGISDCSSLSFVISDLNLIKPELFPNSEYDAWFHLAWAGVNREQINSREVQERNVVFSKKCLNCAKELGCSFFGDFGSRAEYPEDADIIMEDMPELALNEYGIKKKEFYEYASEFCKNAGIKYMHYRIFSVFGPYDHPWSLMMTACNNFIMNKPMEFGACTQIWNYLDVRDLTDMVIEICQKFLNDLDGEENCAIINIANRHSRPLKEYLYEVHEICNSSSVMTFGTKEGFSSNPKLDKIEEFEINSKETPFRESVLDIMESIYDEA